MGTSEQIHDPNIAAEPTLFIGKASSVRVPAVTGNLLRSPSLVRAIRRNPYLYSAICKSRLFHSRHIAGAHPRRLFRRHKRLFQMTGFEAEQVESLRNRGYALVHECFSTEVVDRIYRRADALFHNLQIDGARSYSVQNGERSSLARLSYQELAGTEKTIALADPLINIPELLGIAFHESILKIAANFLHCVPPLYRVTVVRDFPHHRPLHSSNFHKDNDESDSLQIFIYLVDIDDTHGPLVYIPRSNRYDARSCRPRLSRDIGIGFNDGRLSDDEVLRIYPRHEWAVLRTGRGSLAAIHGNGIHKGPAWPFPGDLKNKPRTAIKLDLHGHKIGVVRDGRENRIRIEDFNRMSELQRLFAHATLDASETLAIAQAN